MEEINCFKCTKPMEKKGAIFFSSPLEFFSDNIDAVHKFHLCKDCEEIVLNFMLGKVKQTEVPPKLFLILEVVTDPDLIPVQKFEIIYKTVRSLLQELHEGVPK